MISQHRIKVLEKIIRNCLRFKDAFLIIINEECEPNLSLGLLLEVLVPSVLCK